MCLASAGNTAIAVFLGKLVDSVDPAGHQGLTQRRGPGSAIFFLGLIGASYVVRESMNVLRRYMVENTCTAH